LDKNKIQYIIDIKNNIKKFERWKKYSPANCNHKYNLILAELLSYEKKVFEAIPLYEAAIKDASVFKEVADLISKLNDNSAKDAIRHLTGKIDGIINAVINPPVPVVVATDDGKATAAAEDPTKVADLKAAAPGAGAA
jgi:hypothetical protein